MSEEDTNDELFEEPQQDMEREEDDGLLDLISREGASDDDLTAALDWMTEVRKTEEVQRRSTGQVSKHGIGVLEHIANFGATLDDLRTACGPTTEQEKDAGALDVFDVTALSEQQIRDAVDWCEGKKLIEREKAAGQEDLYLPTDRGMREVGFPDWDLGLSERKGGWILERGGSHGRLVASVAAAASRVSRTNPDHLEKEITEEGTTSYKQVFELWSLWMMRHYGRTRSARYLFEVPVPGRKHFPAVFLYPKSRKIGRAVLYEIFDGPLEDEEVAGIEKILSVWNKRPTVNMVCCYAPRANVPRLAEIIRSLKAQAKIMLVELPEEGGARAIIKAVPVFVPSDEVTAEERKIQWRVMECIGEAGTASVLGLSEYLGLEARQVATLVQEAEEQKWLLTSRYECDGVYLHWLTEKGRKEIELDLPSGRITVSEARFEKERLRVAAALQSRYQNHIILNSRHLLLADMAMPVVGSGEDEYEPALLLRPKSPGGKVVAAMILLDICSRAELEHMVSVCAAQRDMTIIIYSVPALHSVLRKLVEGHDLIKASPLPVSERLLVVRSAEEKRREKARIKAQATAKAKELQASNPQGALEKPKAKKRSRCEIHEPSVPGLRPIQDEPWNKFDKLAKQYLEPPSLHSVSMRLVVNLVIWLIEHEQSVRYVHYHKCLVSEHAFKSLLRLLYHHHLWEPLQDIVREYESKRRGDLRWDLINPGNYKLQQSGRVIREERAAAKRNAGDSADALPVSPIEL